MTTHTITEMRVSPFFEFEKLYIIHILRIRKQKIVYSILLKKKMKKKGFTLVEIVVAITISSIIIGGVFVFLTKLQKDIVLAKATTRVHTNLTDFMGTMHNFEKLYSSGHIIANGSGTYNVGLLTNPGNTQ